MEGDGWGCGTYDRDKSTGDGEKDLAGRIVRVENNAGGRKLRVLVCCVWRVLAEGGGFDRDIMANAGVVVVLGGIHEGQNQRAGLTT